MRNITIGLLLVACLTIGCSNKTTSQTAQVDEPIDQSVQTNDSPQNDNSEVTPESEPSTAIPTISLGNHAHTHDSHDEDEGGSATEKQRRKLLEAMKPVQIMLGKWKGTTQKEVGDFKALDEPEWVWDFQSDRDQPAMVMRSEKSPYFSEARLTYLVEDEVFELKTTDPDGKGRRFVGTFEKPVEEFQGDDQKMHVSYQLQLAQTDGTSPRDTWQVTFNQQQNHRYLVELARKSGSNFLRFDTIATQRDGTSFGKSDVGYGDRECIISGGLGTSQVSHNGKSYWVCCSGCQAAFNEDPESWIAEYQEKTKEND